MYSGVTGDVKPGSAITGGDGGITAAKDEKPFDTMNNIVANLMLNMTRYCTKTVKVEKLGHFKYMYLLYIIILKV